MQPLSLHDALPILPDTEYTVTTSVLAPGGTLLLCSDGLVESSELDMQDGLAQVGEALAEHAENPKQAANVLAEMAPAGRGDDIALLITRKIGRASCRERAKIQEVAGTLYRE